MRHGSIDPITCILHELFCLETLAFDLFVKMSKSQV
eukprot:SAG31_NODE_26916_length_434_cov_0.773134_1_plen_35_part_01